MFVNYHFRYTQISPQAHQSPPIEHTKRISEQYTNSLAPATISFCECENHKSNNIFLWIAFITDHFARTVAYLACSLQFATAQRLIACNVNTSTPRCSSLSEKACTHTQNPYTAQESKLSKPIFFLFIKITKTQLHVRKNFFEPETYPESPDLLIFKSKYITFISEKFHFSGTLSETNQNEFTPFAAPVCAKISVPFSYCLVPE